MCVGYQLSAMANRTVLVDNNTWNNTHIATVGRVFASSEEKAFPILQSLDVDYVLVIFGGKVGQNSDDINKLMWPIRIGKGVFPNDIPEEGAFLDARSGGLNIGPEAPSTLQNCIAYKLCYFRFNEILEYSNGKAGGYDHARRQYIGSKKIELKTMEEAFTSENWIVRIYKVLKQPIFDSISISEHSALFNYKRADNTSTDSLKKPGTQATYIGCYSSEAFFESKIYGGQHIGANMDAGIGHAILNSKPYIAFASNDAGSGHAFAFKLFSQNSNSKKGDRPDAECSVTCDDVSTMSCGCADSACVVDKSKNEKNSRRWSVYQLSAASPIINAGK